MVLQERGELLPPEDSLDISRKVKEMYCYTCSDIVKVLHLSWLELNLVALLLSVGLKFFTTKLFNGRWCIPDEVKPICKTFSLCKNYSQPGWRIILNATYVYLCCSTMTRKYLLVFCFSICRLIYAFFLWICMWQLTSVVWGFPLNSATKRTI